MYIAIVKAESNRATKFQDYATEAECQAHVDRVKPKFPAAFVHNNSAKTPLRDLWVDGETVTVVPVVDYVPTDEDRIDSAFPQTDIARVVFGAFFEVANRLQVLEGKQPITKPQLRAWLKSKLP